MLMENIGEKIKLYRIKAKIKKKEIERASGVTSMTITNIEEGTVSPTLDKLQKILFYLGLKIEIIDKNGDKI